MYTLFIDNIKVKEFNDYDSAMNYVASINSKGRLMELVDEDGEVEDI